MSCCVESQMRLMEHSFTGPGGGTPVNSLVLLEVPDQRMGLEQSEDRRAGRRSIEGWKSHGQISHCRARRLNRNVRIVNDTLGNGRFPYRRIRGVSHRLGSSTTCRLPCKSKSRRKREVSERARESVRSVDRDSGSRTSASRRMIPASDAGPDIHWLSQARQSRHR